ncbi:MAG: glycosyltransferase family 4 protein [Bacteroides sp.]|nr:glycosyltransferase family 4 protein [Bacteroides sp.]
MKVVVTGTRGIPDIQGGVETHCQELFPLIAAEGVDVTVCRRRCYAKDNLTEFRGVKIKDLYAPRKKSIEAAVSTLLGVIYARRVKADWVHIHAVGPSIVIPVAKLLGLKVIMTHHGFDYERKKWGKLARWAIKTGEKMAARFADKIIVISRPIAQRMAEEYGRTDTHLIYNGVPAARPSANTDYITSLGLTPGKYVFALGRLVPEKNFHQLVEAFDVEGYKLVIAGEPDHPDEYSANLKRQGAAAGTVMPGFVHGEQLNQLMTNAALFVLPSSHEGLPITLLEAMSYGRDVLVSNIPANQLEQLSPADFFPVNNVEALRQKLHEKLAAPTPHRPYDLTPYNWPAIATQTLPLYS